LASPLFYLRHDLGAAELASLAKVLEGEILTTGAAVAGFETKFVRALGRRHALASPAVPARCTWLSSRSASGRRGHHHADELRGHKIENSKVCNRTA
jgi:hypothetical protein